MAMPPPAKKSSALPMQEDTHAPHDDVEGPPVARLKCDGTGVVHTAIGAVAVFMVADAVFAIDDACIRCGTSLCDGSVHRIVVTCAGCGWRYDIATGQVKNVPALRAHVYDVSVVDGHVRVSSTPAAWRPL